MITSPEITVAIGQEDLRRFADFDPLKALAELIWNSFDADASTCRIRTRHIDNAHMSLERIVIQDDGRGFELSAAEAFGSFGDSLKKQRQRTVGGRILHGKEGKGRYRSLALGLTAEWSSVARTADHNTIKTTILLDSSAPNRIRPIEEVSDVELLTGVTVTITDPSPRANGLFDSELSTRLAQLFAPRLLADSNFTVFLDDDEVTIDPLIKVREDHDFTVSFGDQDHAAKITVCAWQVRPQDQDDYNCVFLCTESGCAVRRAKGHVFARGITYSAFVRSSYFNETHFVESTESDAEQGSLDVVADSFTREARRLVNDLNRKIVAESAQTAVAELKSEDVYPFETEPSTPLEVAEQQVFDVLAQQYLEMHPTVRQKSPDKKRTLMKALRAAVSSGDEATEIILTQVLDLTPEEKRELKEILERTKLPKLISFAKTITNRLDFVVGLEHILFERDVKKRLRERTQLHRILADHLWLFGEEFHMGTDDVGLRNVLKRHREILELDESAFDPDADYSHLKDIPDLVLYKRIPIRDNAFEFLVVELKAPGKLGEKEFSQIKRYARTVALDPQFTGTWHFLLINNEVDQQLYEAEACQQNRPKGLLVDTANHKVWVKRWNEVIADARGRHEWLKRQLDLQMTDQDGLRYLASRHAEHLPAVVLDKVALADDDTKSSQEVEK